MGDYKKIPPALTPEFTAKIWDEVLPNDMHEHVRQGIINGDLMAGDEHRLKFFQTAMEFPHFANNVELGVYFKMNASAVARLVTDVKRRSREGRNNADN